MRRRWTLSDDNFHSQNFFSSRFRLFGIKYTINICEYFMSFPISHFLLAGIFHSWERHEQRKMLIERKKIIYTDSIKKIVNEKSLELTLTEIYVASMGFSHTSLSWKNSKRSIKEILYGMVDIQSIRGIQIRSKKCQIPSFECVEMFS